MACNNHDIKSVRYDRSQIPTESFVMDLDKRVDVLVVVDNSGSMAEEQGKLAQNFQNFILGLEGVDYRIAVTSTSLKTGPCNLVGVDNYGGVPQTESCLDRPGDFVFAQSDYFQVCQDNCSLTSGDIWATDSSWIEVSNGVSNLKEGVSVSDAFSCIALQGVSGCGFESTLESTKRFVTENPDFFREGALFSLVVLSDEEDCSFQDPSIFSNSGDKTFWTDPESNIPNSGICWNAGVSCNGDPSNLNCVPTDFDSQGQETPDENASVLFSLKSYDSLFESFERFSVSLIAGIPESEPLIYSQLGADPVFLESFGIDPGCSSVGGKAVPPVRLKEFTEGNEGSLYSICSSDYSDTISNIVEKVLKDLPPACYGSCVLDQDEGTEELDYECSVSQRVGKQTTILPECLPPDLLPENADACWVLKSGPVLSPECDIPGQNVEFGLVRRPGVIVPLAADILVSCEVSNNPLIDCF